MFIVHMVFVGMTNELGMIEKVIGNRCRYNHRKWNGVRLNCTLDIHRNMMDVHQLIDSVNNFTSVNISFADLDSAYNRKEGNPRRCMD